MKTHTKYSICLIGGILLSVINFSTVLAQTNIAGGTITTETVWEQSGSPFIIEGNVVIDEAASLTIEENVEIRLNNGLNITVYGNLTANGVTFQSNETQNRGAWGSIRISERNMERGIANISNSIIRHADKALFAEAGADSVTISNTQLLNSLTGLEISSGANYVSLEEVSISGNQWPIKDASLEALATTGDLTISGNDFNGILINTNSVSGTEHKLISSPVPFVFQNTFTVNEGAALTIDAENILKFEQNTRFNVNGLVTADGSASTSAIHFTSILNDNAGGDTNNDGNATSASSGNWDGVFINQTAASGVSFDNIEISFAGRASFGGLNIIGASPTLNNGLIRNSGIGILVSGEANATVSNSTIKNMDTRGVHVTAGDITITNSEIDNANIGLDLGNDAGSTSLENISFSNHEWPIRDASLRALQTSGTQVFTDNEFAGVQVNISSVNDNDHKMAFLPIPYVFGNNFTVNEGAQLSIEPENIIKMEINRRFTVNGTLIANGSTGSSPIHFTSIRNDNIGGDTNNDGTSTAPSSRDWDGIYFTSTSTTTSLLNNVELSFAGRLSQGAVTLLNASPTIENSTFRNSYIGVYIEGTSAPAITGSTFGTSDLYPVAMSLSANPNFSDNVLSFQANEYDAIGIIGGELTANADIIKRDFTDIPNITYVMLNDVTVPAGLTLTVEDGVVIKSWRARFVVQGTMQVNGTVDNEVIFTSVRDDNAGNPNDTNKDGNSTVPTSGDWYGVIFDTGSDASVVNHLSIRYARSNRFNFGGNVGSFTANSSIVIADSDITVSNSEVRNAEIGITIIRDGKPTLQNNSILNTNSTPIALSLSADPTLTGNQIENSGLRGIGLISETVFLNGTIRKRNFGGFENITYVLLGTVTVASGTRVDIEPGVVIKVDGVHTDFFVSGALNAQGNSTDGPVVFTSLRDDNRGNPQDTNRDGGANPPSGRDWGALVFRPSVDNVNSLLDNVEVRFATHGIVMRGASVPVQNSAIQNAEFWGIILDEGSSPTINNVTIEGSGRDPILLSPTTDPQFTNITFTGNNTNGLGIKEGHTLSSSMNNSSKYMSGSRTLTSDSQLRKRNVAGFENIPYILRNQMDVGENTRLTIDPGVVVKFEYQGSIRVDGALIADGTETERIFFTSLRDDSQGGDTNNDGNETTPRRTDWRGVEFQQSGIDAENSLSYVTIRYAGRSQIGSEPLQISNSFVSVNNTIIEQSRSAGVSIRGSANPTIQNTQFLNLDEAPILLDMFSQPDFANNTMGNVGYQAIQVRGETWTSSGIIPVRNFAGFENITYMMTADITVGTGTEITFPAGLVFKSEGYFRSSNRNSYQFIVDGAIKVEGTDTNPVVFTHVADDEFGNPADTENDGNQITDAPMMRYHWLVFNSGSDDLNNSVDHALFRYRASSNNDGSIQLNSSSPTITNSRFEFSDFGIELNGVSEPVVQNNTFHNLNFTPLKFSLVSFPSATGGNVISGTTYRALGVNSETLVQDVTVPKRDFAGISGIPYYFTGIYTVGSGAILTFEPGIINKFPRNARINVQRGLIAEGTEAEPIVFTSILDDFYAGDTNADSTATDPTTTFQQWYGIIFENEALPQFSKLDHVVVRYAGQGRDNWAAIKTESTSPTITNSIIQRNSHGILAEGSSNPVINNNDIFENSLSGITNRDQAFTIDATNNWWGNDSGPTAEGNPDGTGDSVSEGVSFMPFVGSGSTNPQLGDVTLNGKIQAFDASLILKSIVGLETLSNMQEKSADVSGDGTVSAMDASYILQYVVRMINVFPADIRAKGGTPETLADVSDIQLHIGTPVATGKNQFEVSVDMENVENLYSFSIDLVSDINGVTLTGYKAGSALGESSFMVNQVGETVKLAMASTVKLNSEGQIVTLIFETETDDFSLTTNRFFANETEMLGITTTVDNVEPELPADYALKQNYPNPFNPTTNIQFELPEAGDVTLEVYNMIGQRIAVLASSQRFTAGVHTLNFDASALSSGMYIYRIQTGSFTQTRKMMLIK